MISHSSSSEKIKICKHLIQVRLKDMPDNHLFHFAQQQIVFIETHIQAGGKMLAHDYDNVAIGMMCVKELEGIDAEFCNAVYDMNTAIRPPNYEV